MPNFFMNIAVVGTGYVGLVAGACFAESGNDVVCVDVDSEKIQNLQKGVIPIYEPGLEELVKKNLHGKRLRFSTSIQEGVEISDVIFIAVGTPQKEDGSADLRYVLEVATDIGKYMNGTKIIVNKSTVPIGTAELIRKTIAGLTKHEFEVVSNPEFLKEGAALDDFMRPDRVVIGVSSEKAAAVLRDIYSPFVRTNKPILIMDIASAELTKYAANAMLATRVSFINEIALLCEKVGADVEWVRKGIGTDSRIGMSFIFPGIGYGGSCFPKDVEAIIHTAQANGLDFKIAKAVSSANERQKKVLVEKIITHYGSNLAGKIFAIWGLAFKPKTDDVREAPALVICRHLIAMGASLQLFDPEAMTSFRNCFGEQKEVRYCADNYSALENADGLVICTEWNEFRRPNFAKIVQLMKSPVVFDGRNLYEPDILVARGITYYCIGRIPRKPRSI